MNTQKQISYNDCKDCFAVPGNLSMIDVVNPFTGLTACFNRSIEDVQKQYPGAVKMTIEEFCALKSAAQRTPVVWVDTTQEKFWEMLEVLPPAAWVRGKTGSGAFLVGEPTDHDAGNGQPRFQAYWQRGDVFLASNRPVTRSEFKALLPENAAIHS